MTWFSGVPQELNIAGIRFWMASEALEDQERRLDSWQYAFDEQGERPDPDWAATSLFLLARVQLDQLVEILEREFSIQASACSGAEVARRLGESFEESDDPMEDISYEIAIVGESVDLWRALRAAGGRPVGHGFAVDGSTITTGPDLPELAALGLRGSESGELETSPKEVLERASSCTLEVARLAAMRRQLDRQRERAGKGEEPPRTRRRPWSKRVGRSGCVLSSKRPRATFRSGGSARNGLSSNGRSASCGERSCSPRAMKSARLAQQRA